MGIYRVFNKAIKGETQVVHGLAGQYVILVAKSCLDAFGLK